MDQSHSWHPGLDCWTSCPAPVKRKKIRDCSRGRTPARPHVYWRVLIGAGVGFSGATANTCHVRGAQGSLNPHTVVPTRTPIRRIPHTKGARASQVLTAAAAPASSLLGAAVRPCHHGPRPPFSLQAKTWLRLRNSLGRLYRDLSSPSTSGKHTSCAFSLFPDLASSAA